MIQFPAPYMFDSEFVFEKYFIIIFLLKIYSFINNSTFLSFQEALAVKSVPMNNFNVQINAYPNDGNATTTKIVKMARTNKIVVSLFFR